MTKQASDIHIEPQATMTVVRIRVDGCCAKLENVRRTLQNSLSHASRFSPNGHRRTARSAGRLVVWLSARAGWKCASRRSDAVRPKSRYAAARGSARVSFGRFGFCVTCDRISQMLSCAGMLWLRGPTGSGKSPSLYSCLNLVA